MSAGAGGGWTQHMQSGSREQTGHRLGPESSELVRSSPFAQRESTS